MKTTQKTPRWIWNADSSTLRNSWTQFRKVFNIKKITADNNISIVADSRYILFINGRRIGQGPMKFFQDKIPYDSYDLTDYIKEGANVIGVLVHNIGIATMQYQYGEPGLWVSGEASGADLSSNTEWYSKKSDAFDYRSIRKCVQQDFTEHFNLNFWENFSDFDYIQDDSWKKAVICEKSTDKLYPRDIPMLTNEICYPVRALRLSAISKLDHSFSIDFRDLVLKDESYKNCNSAVIQAAAFTLLKMESDGDIVFYGDIARFRPFYIDGKWYEQGEINNETYVEKTIPLKKGTHLITFNLFAYEHWMGLHFATKSDVIHSFLNPIKFDSPTPFVIADAVREVNYDPCGALPLPSYNEALKAIIKAGEEGSLDSIKDFLITLPTECFCEDSPFLQFVYSKESELPSNNDMQNIVLPDYSFYDLPKISEKSTGITIDFGKELVGYLELEFFSSKGTIIDVYSYEFEYKHKIQHTWGLDPTWRIICSEGKNKLKSFTRRGLRYLKLMVTYPDNQEPLRIYSVKMHQATYPLVQLGSFSCSDYELNEIWKMSAHTVKMCTEDTFVDCPAYEQVFWVGDSRNESLIARYVYGASTPTKRCLEMVPLSAPQNPLLTSHLPSGWDNVIPNWTFLWVIACAEYYEYSRDIDFLKNIVKSASDAMDAYHNHINNDGMLDIKAWNLLDWAEIEQPNDGIVSHQNMLFVYAMNCLSDMLNVVGDIDKSKIYSTRANLLKKSINTHLWNDEKQSYIDCIYKSGERSKGFSVQTQIVALLSNIADDDKKDKVYEIIKNAPENYVNVRSPFMSFFLHELFEENNDIQNIIDDIKENFGEMLRYGSTTCWEQYASSPLNKHTKDMLSRSHCHAWSAGPAYFLTRNILGVKMDAGWKSAKINPHPCGVKWANGRVPLPDGNAIEIHYSNVNNHIDMTIFAPDYFDLNISFPENYSGSFNVIKKYL